MAIAIGLTVHYKFLKPLLQKVRKPVTTYGPILSTEKDPVSFRHLVMSGGGPKINMNAIQKIP